MALLVFGRICSIALKAYAGKMERALSQTNQLTARMKKLEMPLKANDSVKEASETVELDAEQTEEKINLEAEKEKEELLAKQAKEEEEKLEKLRLMKEELRAQLSTLETEFEASMSAHDAEVLKKSEDKKKMIAEFESKKNELLEKLN